MSLLHTYVTVLFVWKEFIERDCFMHFSATISNAKLPVSTRDQNIFLGSYNYHFSRLNYISFMQQSICYSRGRMGNPGDSDLPQPPEFLI